MEALLQVFFSNAVANYIVYGVEQVKAMIDVPCALMKDKLERVCALSIIYNVFILIAKL